MGDLRDGESVKVQGSAALPYELKNTGGVFSCTCPAWRNQSVAIEKRTCKHLRALRGDAVETARVGAAATHAPATTTTTTTSTTTPSTASEPPLLLAHVWEHDTDLAGWWMSEKLDGVRAYWDGKRFVSRLGNEFHVPDWFAEGLPGTPLDGELWVARKAFQRTVSIVRRQDKGDAWKHVTYVVFDAPSHGGPFEDRLEAVRTHLGKVKAPFARFHPHERCRGEDHLRAELARVEALGGEGLMLRKPGSKYEVGRSSTLLKVKSFHDAEARVVGHEPGTGKHKGRLGALLVELPDGTRFAVGTGLSDAEREHPPAVGAVITFRYQELSQGGVPRFPSYVGVRADATWPPKNAVLPAKPPAALAAAKPVATPAAKPATKPAVRPATAAKPLAQGRGARYFEATGKFWEITLDGNSHTVRFGRAGTAGRSQKRVFGDAASAARDARRLVDDAVKMGYVEK